MSRAPGTVRDAIMYFLSHHRGDASVGEIHEAVAKQLGEVSPSSVRSYLNLHVPDLFERTDRGRYRLMKKKAN